MDMKFGAWNMWILHMSGSLNAVSRGLMIQVRFNGSTGLQKGQGRCWARTGFFACKRMISAVKRVKVLSNRMSYRVLRGCWCDISMLDVRAPTEEESDDSKDSF